MPTNVIEDSRGIIRISIRAGTIESLVAAGTPKLSVIVGADQAGGTFSGAVAVRTIDLEKMKPPYQFDLEWRIPDSDTPAMPNSSGAFHFVVSLTGIGRDGRPSDIGGLVELGSYYVV
jgi:hypothetical protein